jgi:hypothetical protein
MVNSAFVTILLSLRMRVKPGGFLVGRLKDKKLPGNPVSWQLI